METKYQAIDSSMPYSIKKAATQLYEEFIKFMEVNCLDVETSENLKRIFGDHTQSIDTAFE